MRKLVYILSIIFLLSSMSFTCAITGCSTKNISECDAIKIAKEQVPDRIAECYTNSGFRQELGSNGLWFVNFANVYTTPEEMGWVENENTHFIWGNNPFAEPDVTPGVYRIVVIYVDTNGNVTGRELNNGIIIGPLPHECD